MNHEDLAFETQKRLHELFRSQKKKAWRLPTPGDCFFLVAPTLRPEQELDHALVAGISEAGVGLVCAKISLEYWMASEHDYMLDAGEWTGGYPVIVETWNAMLLLPREPALIHARIHPGVLDDIRQLFLWHQTGQSPPPEFRGGGKPMPDDPDHSAWAFRAKEAGVMERARRHYHEGWDVELVRVATPRRGRHLRADRKREIPMVASSEDLASRIEAEIIAQKHDQEILITPTGTIFLRRDRALQGYSLLWYSPEGHPPPEVKAEPSLDPPEAPSGGVQLSLGSWRQESLGKEALLMVRTEGFSRDILVRLPRKRK